MTDSTENCTSCGANVPLEARFCVECGVQLGTAVSAVTALQTVSGLETVMPQDHDGGPGGTGPAALNRGDVVAGKFEVERTIGQGGMGIVYKAKELVSGEQVALKVIGQKFVSSDNAVQRLIDEGTTTRGISHPNVVQIFDIGLHGAQPYIAMEYIDGRPLHVWRGEKMANGEAVPIQVASQIVKEILIGLEAAHGAGVIHRDLKPENVMLLDEPTGKLARVKIVDFGIALGTKTATASGTGTGLGTHLYMAPEQIRNANSANASADLYSLSKIFYELIVGVLPTGHWQPPSGGRADVLPQVDALIEKGLSHNRDMRPQTAEEYRTALISAMNGRRDVKQRRSNKFPLYASVAVIAFFGLAIVFGDDEVGPDPEPPVSVESFDRQVNGSLSPPPPPPPPPPPTFAYFNGTWADGFGGAYRINVNESGGFRGAGYLGDGTSVSIAGEMDNQNLTYSIGFNGQVVADGNGARTDQCHFSFTTRSYITGEYSSGSFHVNHEPGEACP